jgi:hypothetical protein
MQNISHEDFLVFMQKTILNAFKMCTKGLAFNLVSPFVDYKNKNVYYSDIVEVIYFLRDNLGRFFSINHDYALYEYTVFVFKEEYIKSKHGQEEFLKYFKTSN